MIYSKLKHFLVSKVKLLYSKMYTRINMTMTLLNVIHKKWDCKIARVS